MLEQSALILTKSAARTVAGTTLPGLLRETAGSPSRDSLAGGPGRQQLNDNESL
jgi:hypothetical protein